VDTCSPARLYLNGAAQQRGQHLGAHLAVWTPAISACRVILFRIPSAEFHGPSGRESIPDPPLGIGQISRNDHAQHHAPPDGQCQLIRLCAVKRRSLRQCASIWLVWQ
jgi:hypothetical protein